MIVNISLKNIKCIENWFLANHSNPHPLSFSLIHGACAVRVHLGRARVTHPSLAFLINPFWEDRLMLWLMRHWDCFFSFFSCFPFLCAKLSLGSTYGGKGDESVFLVCFVTIWIGRVCLCCIPDPSQLHNQWWKINT